MQTLCHVLVQNEVAYEYFGDRFSVTAERTYKQVYSKTNSDQPCYMCKQLQLLNHPT